MQLFRLLELAEEHGLTLCGQARELLRAYVERDRQGERSVEITISNDLVGDTVIATRVLIGRWEPYVAQKKLTRNQLDAAWLKAFLDGLRDLESQSIVGAGKPEARTNASALALLHGVIAEHAAHQKVPWSKLEIAGKTFLAIAFEVIRRTAHEGVPTWEGLRAEGFLTSNALSARYARLRACCKRLRLTGGAGVPAEDPELIGWDSEGDEEPGGAAAAVGGAGEDES